MSSPHQYEHDDVSHIYLWVEFVKFYFFTPSFLTIFKNGGVKNSARTFERDMGAKILV